MKRKNNIFLKFIEEKGIAKKILNYLEEQGTTEISLVALRFIVRVGIISVIINIILFNHGYVTKFGVAVQQGINFSVKVASDIIINMMNTLKYFDEKSPGTLSMVGTIANALIGLIAVLSVFRRQIVLKSKTEMRNLMSVLLSTYRAVNIFKIEGTLDILKTPSKNPKFIKGYSSLVYDKDWSKYLVNIKNYDDREHIMRWFFCLEQAVYMDDNNLSGYNKDIRKILIKNGFTMDLTKVNRELKIRKNKKNEENKKNEALAE